jgi:lipid II:glycine glycyltransferase (peptidoglycan interpeptide bridge formation enzyme)
MQPANLQPETWNKLVASLPNPHLLQTWEWAQVKAKYGWTPIPQVWKDANGQPVAAAMLLKRTVPAGGFAARMSLLYIPKGPLMDWNDAQLRTRVLNDLQALGRKHGAIFVKVDPDVALGTGVPGREDSAEDANGQAVASELSRRGWRFSSDQVQFRNTVLLDLTPSEDQILAAMKQKTRYNIRLAEKKGVTVRAGTTSDLPLLYKMYAETSARDGFVIRDQAYYQTVWGTFMRPPASTLQLANFPACEPLIAEVGGVPVAGLFLFRFAGRAYYLYGMSRDAHREKMPTYLLQWEAVRRAKAAGCTVYDLWGAPDTFDESDSLWGVFRFKEGLGGQVVRTLGAWDYAPNALTYGLYTKIIPRLLDVMRARGKARTKQGLES